MKPLVVVDLFAGAGGFSTGLLRACARLGRPVKLMAINHWKEAVHTHSLNHPDVIHHQEDLGLIDPREALLDADLGLAVDLLIAAPECTEHSYSRGDKPIKGQSRATAWHVLRWIDQVNVKRLIIENVPPFRGWGPTDRNGRPIKARRGETYREYLDMVRRMNFTVEARVLNAADYGGATTRKRLFILGEKGTRKVRFPVPTHAPATSLLPGMKPWRGAKEIIDPTLEGRSIFRRMFEGDPLAFNTMQRILVGGERYWPEYRPFLTILRNHMAAQSVDGPVPTVAASGNHIGLAEPIVVKFDHAFQRPAGAARGADEPIPTVTSKCGLGVADPVLVNVAHGDMSGRARTADEPAPTLTGSRELGVAEAFLIGQQSNAVPRPLDQPTPTIATAGKIAHVEPIIVPCGGAWEDRAQPADEPLRTLTGTESKGVAEPIIVGAGGPRGQGKAQPASEPLRTILAENHQAVAEPIITTYHGNHRGKADATRRVKPAAEPLGTQDGSNRFGIAEPVVIVNRTNNVPHTTDEPVPCLNTGGHIGVASAFLLQQQSGGAPRPVDEPVPTVATGGAIAYVEPVGRQIVIPFNGEREGQAPRSHSTEEPLPTVTTGGAGQKGVASPLLVSYYANGHAHSVEQPLGTLTGKDRYGLVTADFTPEDVAGFDRLTVGTITPWGIKIGKNLYLDIRFRMLKVHELAAAMGFPKGYRFVGTQDEQVKQVGNAVSVEMAEALCFAVLA